LRDRHLDWQISRLDAAIFALRELAFGVVLLPLCAAGLAIFFVPYHVTALIASRVTSLRDIYATAQVVAGIVVYGLWLMLIGVLLWHFIGTRAAWMSMLALPILAVLALLAIERESAVIDAVRAWWSLRSARLETREHLRRDRAELAEVLEEARRWLDSETSG
jgi:hypothetical protein